MDGTGAFLDMISAYRSELGDAFPAADPRSVLLILRQCNKPEPTTQKQIEKTTGISQPNLAKMMATLIDRGWLEAAKRDPKTGVKNVQLTLNGFLVLTRFEDACQSAVKSVRKKKVSGS